MAPATLLDYFDEFTTSSDEFLVYDDGYRARRHRYDEVGRAAHLFADRLHESGIGKGDKVIFWAENRPEWIVALWGCLLAGVVVVPIDYRASQDMLRRIHAKVRARALLIGRDVTYEPASDDPPVWRMTTIRWKPDPNAAGSGCARPDITPSDVVEIVFTSGATAEPKGVVLTHRNVVANIAPVHREIQKYRRYGRPFFPIRFLNVLPLSHMFGQAMATFIPPLLSGVVVFMRGYNPDEIVRQVKQRRVSVLVCVPKILDVLHHHIVRLAPEAADSPPAPEHWLRRWWRYRRVHRLLGLKFWSFVVGAAPLDPELERFWSRLGFLVVQGYGLTETAPIVTLNHPFKASAGTVGSPISGVELQIAPDGEILVRGDNVTQGYYGEDAATSEAFADGWFHTGDVGQLDDAGRLLVRGRKKEMIVTPEGLNVFPEDIERVLNETRGVRESAVVGHTTRGEERVHAVLVLDDGTDTETVIRQANAQLEDHQKLRGATVWPRDELPRTEGTRKLKRRELQQWLASEGRDAPAQAPAGATVQSVIGEFAAGRTIDARTTMDELGLSSLERVELLMELENRFQTTIDEGALAGARTVSDLQQLIDAPAEFVGGPASAPAETIEFPTWNRSRPARLLRRLSLATWILPLQRLVTPIDVHGVEHLRDIEGPVAFASNHQSHMDVPVILKALPRRWRYRVAPAMAKEFFGAHFFPERHTRRQVATSRLNYYLAALFFNAFPLPQREVGTRQTLRYVGNVVDDGDSVLIFPEGKRTDHGEINPYHAGIGMIGARLGLPVVPVRIEGLDKVLHHSWSWPRRGRVEVRFGPPLHLDGDDFARQAKRVEEAARKL